MDSSFLIPAEAYRYIYYLFVSLVCLRLYAGIAGYSADNLIEKPAIPNIPITFFALLVILFIGLRPISKVFPDMIGYATMYNKLTLISTKNEEGLWWLAKACQELGFDANVWFLVVCAAYYGFTMRAAKLLSPNNWEHIFITFLIAFSTLAYAISGIRNGLALASLTLGFSIFLTKEGRGRFVSILFFAFAYMTHKSSILPLVCFFTAYYLVNFKRALYFWLFSIVLSLTVGSSVSNIFMGLGFDDRLGGYLHDVDYSGFSRAGFRWDFLLYSMMPILLGYYVLIKKGIEDRIYEILISTYVLANAFWVMVIRAQFSDRFAYLSWFMYAVVIAYPLFSVDIWGNEQGRIAKNILYAHLSFTLFMNIIYYTVLKATL